MLELTEHPTMHGQGVRFTPDGLCHWDVWAPRAQSVQLVLLDHGRRAVHDMHCESDFYSACCPTIAEGQRYAYSLDGGPDLPDPASKWQPDGVHSPSAVWDPRRFLWTDADWCGVRREDLVVYELHVGTFTPEGTFAVIIPRLAALRDLGITAIELMPVGQFPGRYGWGYDGTYWYAVQASYGGPRELQNLVDACHAAGLAVILDVVYNHLGPEGNYLEKFGPYFTDRHQTPWGNALNYDGSGSDVVRDFVLQNVRQWIRDFHLDGLRLDAVQSIFDSSPRHLLADIKVAANDEADKRGWPALVIAESCLNEVRLLHEPDAGGYGVDAQWNDDFHHTVHALLTGERTGYYSDYHSPPEQLAKALNSTFVYDGCYSAFLGRQHGVPVGDLAGDRFVVSVQTHDQVGNRAQGDRLAAQLQPAQLRLAAALLLLSPHLPLLFMGEEYGEMRPFPFFCDFGDASLHDAVRNGRRQEFATFAWNEIADPQSEATFHSATLTWTWPEGAWQAGLRRLYQDLIVARRSWPALRDFSHREATMVSATDDTPLLRLIRGDDSHPDRHVEAWFNLGPSTATLPEDIGADRPVLLTTEAVRYGGSFAGARSGHQLAPFECLVLQPSGEVRS